MVYGKQPEGRIAAVIQDQIIRPGRGQMLTSKHALADLAGFEIGLDHQAVKDIIQTSDWSWSASKKRSSSSPILPLRRFNSMDTR